MAFRLQKNLKHGMGTDGQGWTLDATPPPRQGLIKLRS